MVAVEEEVNEMTATTRTNKRFFIISYPNLCRAQRLLLIDLLRIIYRCQEIGQ